MLNNLAVLVRAGTAQDNFNVFNLEKIERLEFRFKNKMVFALSHKGIFYKEPGFLTTTLRLATKVRTTLSTSEYFCVFFHSISCININKDPIKSRFLTKGKGVL